MKPSPGMRCLSMPKSVAAVGDELVGLFEGAFVEQQLDALAGGELAVLVLALAAFGATALLGQGVAAFQFSDGGGVGMGGMGIVHAKRIIGLVVHAERLRREPLALVDASGKLDDQRGGLGDPLSLYPPVFILYRIVDSRFKISYRFYARSSFVLKCGMAVTK